MSLGATSVPRDFAEIGWFLRRSATLLQESHKRRGFFPSARHRLSAAKIDCELKLQGSRIDQPGYESDALIARIHDSTAVKLLDGAPKF
jgi:hypothetical protein